MKKWTENKSVGAGLIAGGLAIRYLAPTIPEKQRGIAQAAGVIFIGAGGIILYNSIKGFAPNEPLINQALGALVGVPPDAELAKKTEDIENRPTTAPPFIGPSGPPLPNATPYDTLRINNIKPGHGGGVRDNGFMSENYDITLSLQNNNDKAFEGNIIFRLQENYLFTEETGTLMREAYVAPRTTSMVKFTLPLISYRVFGDPTIDAEIGVFNPDRGGFHLKCRTSWKVIA